MLTLKGIELIEQLGIDYFKQGSTFGALSDEAIRYMVERGEVIQLDKGDQLFQFCDPVDSFYIILEGTIQFSGSYQEKNDIVRDFTFGEQIGFVPMIALNSHIGNAQATEDSIVLKVSNGLFYDIHEKLPSDFGILMLNLSREMARRIQELFKGY